MSKYLYGVSVQGIQEFIFKTNKLKEIAGASQLVDSISSIDWDGEHKSKFEEFCAATAKHTVLRKNIIMSAAGNIKYRIEDDDALDSYMKSYYEERNLKVVIHHYFSCVLPF